MVAQGPSPPFAAQVAARVDEVLARVASSADPEAIHDARVALRRADALLVLVRPRRSRAWDKAMDALDDLRSSLGGARDDEVTAELLATLPSRGNPWAATTRQLFEQRAAAARAAAAADVATHAPVLHHRLMRLEDPELRAGRALRRFGHTAARVSRRARQFQKHRDFDHLHRLRIALKKFRYQAEVLAEHGWLTPPPDLAAHLKRVQDELGGTLDLWMAARQLSQVPGHDAQVAQWNAQAEVRREGLRGALEAWREQRG